MGHPEVARACAAVTAAIHVSARGEGGPSEACREGGGGGVGALEESKPGTPDGPHHVLRLCVPKE